MMAILSAAFIAVPTASQDGSPSATAAEPAPCRASDVSKSLDFWVGDWDVYVGKDLNGHDAVKRILGGCAITEDWRDVDGSRGNSLFAYDARKGFWTQTWVTENSSLPGGIKVKFLRAHGPGMTTFQGEIEGKSGAVYYDRTILTALRGGNVRQQIQVSRNGVNWLASFDAIYVPVGSGAPK